MSQYDEILGDGRGVLFLLHARFLLFHNSNVFLRDLQYGIREYLMAKGIHIDLNETEGLARALVKRLEESKFLRPMDEQTWTLLDPEFKRMTEKVPPGPTPKPQAPAAQAPATNEPKKQS